MTVDYHAILPELILAGTILIVLVVDLFLPARLKWASMPIALLGVLGSLVAVLTLLGDERSTFGGAFVVDNFAVLFKVFFLDRRGRSSSRSRATTSTNPGTTRASTTSCCSRRSWAAC